MNPADRRETHRLRLDKPILGRIDGRGALVLDIGSGGVLVEHYGAFEPEARFELTFPAPSGEISYVCSVAHSRVMRTASDGSSVSHTGARLQEPIGDSARRLQELARSFVAKVLVAQQMNAQGDAPLGDSFLLRIGAARRMRAHGFVICTFANGMWTVSPGESPRQPPDGFTVGAHEDDHEIHLLCESYERADVEGRSLIRMLADMSARATKLPI